MFDKFRDKLWELKFKLDTNPEIKRVAIVMTVYVVASGVVYVAFKPRHNGDVLVITDKMRKALMDGATPAIHFIGSKGEYYVTYAFEAVLEE